jgi:hypothetical protein
VPVEEGEDATEVGGLALVSGHVMREPLAEVHLDP